MAGKDMILVRQRDLKRLPVMHKVIESALTQVQAAEILSISERQVRRIVKRLRKEGASAIEHRTRGRNPITNYPRSC